MSRYKSISIHFIPLTLLSDHCVAFCEVLHSALVAPLISPSDLSADGLSLKTASGHGERLGTNDSPPHAHTQSFLTRGDTFAFGLFKFSRRRPGSVRNILMMLPFPQHQHISAHSHLSPVYKKHVFFESMATHLVTPCPAPVMTCGIV